jgi:hypothetical protein
LPVLRSWTAAPEGRRRRLALTGAGPVRSV